MNDEKADKLLADANRGWGITSHHSALVVIAYYLRELVRGDGGAGLKLYDVLNANWPFPGYRWLADTCVSGRLEGLIEKLNIRKAAAIGKTDDGLFALATIDQQRALVIIGYYLQQIAMSLRRGTSQ